MAEDSNNNFFGENDLLKYQFMFEELYKFMGHDVEVVVEGTGSEGMALTSVPMTIEKMM